MAQLEIFFSYDYAGVASHFLLVNLIGAFVNDYTLQ